MVGRNVMVVVSTTIVEQDVYIGMTRGKRMVDNMWWVCSCGSRIDSEAVSAEEGLWWLLEHASHETITKVDIRLKKKKIRKGMVRCPDCGSATIKTAEDGMCVCIECGWDDEEDVVWHHPPVHSVSTIVTEIRGDKEDGEEI